MKQLRLELEEQRYSVLPAKLITIYKNNKGRNIALFCMRDKIIQESIATELSKIFDIRFSKSTYAYRPGYSALRALELIADAVKKEKVWVLKLDIESFFDNVLIENLMDVLEKSIYEKPVLELIKKTLEVSFFNDSTGKLEKKEKGLFQGSACSPILSNIYLMEYDHEMVKRSDFYLRYSDDILIVHSSENELRGLLEYTKDYLKKMGLKLNDKKTIFLQMEQGKTFDFLGYSFTTQGKVIPVKAEISLENKLEAMWLETNVKVQDKIRKGQEILGGWEQYYQEARTIGSVIEYVIVLSMTQNKSSEVIEKIEKQRFKFVNHYRDILLYMVEYWKRLHNIENIVKEFEQFYGIDKYWTKSIPEIAQENLQNLAKLYIELADQKSEEKYLDIIQFYTDVGHYGAAADFWKLKEDFQSNSALSVPHSVPVPSRQQEKIKVDIQEYMNLFVGREDSYVKESLSETGKRGAEQIYEPLTQKVVQAHLDRNIIAGTYVQRPNRTSKYAVFDVDISKKILIENPYGTKNFQEYKKKALEKAVNMCHFMKNLGLQGYIEDSGFRGYHIWIFFTEWILTRYTIRLMEYVIKNVNSTDEDITIENFPNQSRIKPGKAGAYIKLPLGLHIKSKNQSYFLDEQFQAIENYTEYFASAARYSLDNIKKVLGAYTMEPEENTERKEVDRDLESFGELPVNVRLVLENCNLMCYLCQKARTTGYLSHSERLSVLYVFGHMGEQGKEFVHTVMNFTMNYQYHTTQKFIIKMPEKPISCIKLREQYRIITAEYGCNCNFRRTKNCYPSPVLHAIKNSEEEETEITVPTSRQIPKGKQEEVYGEVNLHKKAQNLAGRIVELKKQNRSIEKSIQKLEMELQNVFDTANVDCLEIEMGLLVRKKIEGKYEWSIEL